MSRHQAPSPLSSCRLVAACALAVFASVAAAAAQAPPRQTQEDDYTRYELLAPGTAKFHILYEVTATTPGARFFFNTIRKGSIATDETVIDMMTGQELKWEVVGGAQARTEGHPAADLDTDYIKVHLRQPVPEGGQVRVLIDKTYEDPKSYFQDGNAIVFDRSLGIRRNAVVLPPGYRIVSLNVPSQVVPTPDDGRVMVSFMNPGPGAAPLVIRAEPGVESFVPRLSSARGSAVTSTRPSQTAQLAQRAHDDREITYDLGEPSTHAFSVQHDYEEHRLGVSQYFDVVPRGRTVQRASAVLLDTGETLKVETVSGAEIERRGLDPGALVEADTQVIVTSFPAIPRSGSVRLRLSEAFTDEGRYYRDGESLVWDGVFSRPRNTLVLPAGWTAVAVSSPATITTTSDGRQQLYFENDRNGDMTVLIRARRIKIS